MIQEFVTGLVFVAHGNRHANCVTGEVWQDKPPLRLNLNKATSDDIAWRCKHYSGRGAMKFTSLVQLWASLKMTSNPHGGGPSVSWRQVLGRSLWQAGLREVLPQRHFGNRFHSIVPLCCNGGWMDNAFSFALCARYFSKMTTRTTSKTQATKQSFQSTAHHHFRKSISETTPQSRCSYPRASNHRV